MDDITIIAPHLSINVVWEPLITKSAAVGLTVNTEKCQIYSANMDKIQHEITLPAEVKRRSDGLVIVGAPIGSEDFQFRFWDTKIKVIRRNIEKVCKYQDTQVAMQFMSKCIATQLNYFTRMTDPSLPTAGFLTTQMDNDLCYGLGILLKRDNLQPTDRAWIQARLAGKHSGLGIQSPKVTHPGAYLAAQIACRNLIKTQIDTLQSHQKYTYLCEELRSVIGQMLVEVERSYGIIKTHSVSGGTDIKLTSLADLMNGSHTKLQKKLNLHVSQDYYQQLREQCTGDDLVRLSTHSGEASVLVNVLPKKELWRIPSDQYTQLLCTRLGLPIHYIKTGKCSCGGDIDNDGYHLYSTCRFSNQQVNNTHNAVRDQWYMFGMAAGYRCSRENAAVFRQQGITDQNGRVDVVYECFEDAKPLYLDISVTDARQLKTHDYVNGSKRVYKDGHQAMVRETSKHKDYKCFTDTNAIFRPIVSELAGLQAPEARTTFKTVATKLHHISGGSKGGIVYNWRANILMTQYKISSRGLKERADAEIIKAAAAAGFVLEDVNYDTVAHCRT